MVDISDKATTKRIARAEAIVDIGKEIANLIADNEIQTKKGAVFQTAILAGVMASKKTSDLIPLCHPIGLEDCKVVIQADGGSIRVEAVTTVTGKTGVEMEALTAVSVAALTIYDMCKALSHDIEIRHIRLMEKTGGKSDFVRK